MAITQAMCTSFKTELLGGVQDLDTDHNLHSVVYKQRYVIRSNYRVQHY